MAMSWMRQETLEAPAVVEFLLQQDEALYGALVAELLARPPHSVVTLARGSSDHAAAYTAYLVMARLGVPVASLPPSLFTLYGTPFDLPQLLVLAFSQSGKSPDLVESAAWLHSHGSRVMAVVNDVAAPLAATPWCFSVYAGQERSVAATKSCLAQMVVGARLVGLWQRARQEALGADGDQAGAVLLQALSRLPACLRAATEVDWSAAVEVLRGVSNMYVIGRGPGLALAREAALKLKETALLHAEAFSAAEVRHGPMALVRPGFVVLVFALPGKAEADLLALAAEMRERGAEVLLVAQPGTAGVQFPVVSTGNEDLDPIVALLSFYLFAEAVARARGCDPDRPPHLQKVTLTH